VIVGAVLVPLIVLWALLITVWGVPKVAIQNDLASDVGFRNCRDWHKISKGKVSGLRPLGPCSVYSVKGHLISYLGCLYFPDEAFTDGEMVRVSSLHPGVSQPDCAGGEDYERFAPATNARSRVVEWLTP